MTNWSRSEVIGIAALLIAVIATFANIWVIRERHAKRNLLIAVTVCLIGVLVVLLKVTADEASKAQARSNAETHAALVAHKNAEAQREAAIREAMVRIRTEDAERQAATINAREIAVKQATERLRKRSEPPELVAAKKAILGKWNGGFFRVDFIFKSDGRFVISQSLQNVCGRYRFIDSSDIEVTTHACLDVNQLSEPVRAKVRVVGDTIHMKSSGFLNGTRYRDRSYRED